MTMSATDKKVMESFACHRMPKIRTTLRSACGLRNCVPGLYREAEDPGILRGPHRSYSYSYCLKYSFEIERCSPVRNKWYYGWGIRRLERGWMYNVSGLDAVEICMKNGKIYRIGTDEPETLCNFIQERLTKSKS